MLDPACGSGNFLYIAYRELRRLERDAIEKIRELRKSEHIAGQLSFGYVAPEQFFGMDINSFAVEIAKVTMMLGKKLADDELHEIGQTLPLNNLDKNFRACDALFTPWPAASAIVGNPPYLGRRKMLEELGAAYNNKLNEAFGARGVSDFVTYWIPLAHDHLPVGGRAGFVATKSVKQGDGRKYSLDYVVDNGGAIFNAVSSTPWSGVANVHVSIVNWQKGGELPTERVLWMNLNEQPLVLDEITPRLTPEINLRDARVINASKQAAYQGVTNNVKKAFEPSPFEARQLAKATDETASALHPLLGGDVMLHKTSTNEWIIDVPTQDADVAWTKYRAAMERLKTMALPIYQAKADKEKADNAPILAENPKAKVNKHWQAALTRWWVLWRRRAEYQDAVSGLDRYIAVNRAASNNRTPVFAFVDGRFLVNDSIVAFPFSDDYSFGILQSSIHEQWFRARGSTLGTAPRYGVTQVSDTFPWPQAPTAEAVEAVAKAASALVAHTGEAFRLGTTLGDQYDVLSQPGNSTLRMLKAALDEAVIAAYGFDAEDNLLVQILALNLIVAEREAREEPVTKPGPQPNSVEPSTWRWPAREVTEV